MDAHLENFKRKQKIIKNNKGKQCMGRMNELETRDRI